MAEVGAAGEPAAAAVGSGGRRAGGQGGGGAAGADLPSVPPRGRAGQAAGPRGSGERAWHPTSPGAPLRLPIASGKPASGPGSALEPKAERRPPSRSYRGRHVVRPPLEAGGKHGPRHWGAGAGRGRGGAGEGRGRGRGGAGPGRGGAREGRGRGGAGAGRGGASFSVPGMHPLQLLWKTRWMQPRLAPHHPPLMHVAFRPTHSFPAPKQDAFIVFTPSAHCCSQQ